MPRTSVAEVLACLGDEFAAFAAAFCRGDYVLWLGSGISRDVVPSVRDLLQHMLEFLRSRIDPTDSDCRFKKAFEQVLDVAVVPPEIRSTITLTSRVETWPSVKDIVSRLEDRYSDVLNVQVRGEPADFLVWTGLDVPTTYGDAGLEPDAEHLCVALLMLEGVVSSAATTNWDGLVEVAMGRLSGDFTRDLQVVVRADDFGQPARQSELLKFHGCAVRAVADKTEYRDRLIARTIQISGWAIRPENQMMRNRLQHLFASRSAFIVGLSAQDADIHTVLHQAIQGLSRDWTVAPPAVVFAEQTLHRHHMHVLQVTYGDDYSPNADAINNAALLGAFAKPALIALVLFALTDKLCDLITCVSELSLPKTDLDGIRAGLRQLRDIIGGSADADPRAFIDEIVSSVAFVLSTFRTGHLPDPTRYQQISVDPIVKALENPDFPGAALGRLAIVVSLLGRGMAEGQWNLALGTRACPCDGVVRVVRPHETSRLFVVRNARSLAQLEVSGVVDLGDGDIVVVQAEASDTASKRSPGTRYGRTGAARARWVDFERICGTVSTACGLLAAFRLEAAL